MVDLIVLLGAATLVAVLFHYFKVPPIVAFFAAGAVVGPHGLGLINSPPNLELMTEGAALILMFTIGLEFSYKKLFEMSKPLLVLGIGQVTLTVLAFILLLSKTLGYPTEKAIFFSFLISLSSTAVVFKLLSDNRDFETPHGRAAFSILLSQDIAVIPMIVVIPLLKNINEAAGSFADSIVPFLLLGATGLILFIALSRYVLPPLLYRVARTGSREIFFFCILFILASLALLLHKIGLSVSLGAFIAGMLIAGSPYGKQATADFLPLRDAFLGLFFVIIGMLIDSKFIFMNIHKVLMVGVIILSVKVLIMFSLLWFVGYSGTVSRIVSLLLLQFGEFGFVLADQGFRLNLLSQKELQYFIALAIITLIATPFIYRLIPILSEPKRFSRFIPAATQNVLSKVRGRTIHLLASNSWTQSLNSDVTYQDHVIIIGFGIAGQSVSKALRFCKIPYVIIETNIDTVRAFSKQEPIIFGDATSESILHEAHISRARMVIIVTSSVSTIEPILIKIRHCALNTLPVIVRTNYILDLNRFKNYEGVDFIVSEVEASYALIENLMHKMDIEQKKKEEFLLDFRDTIQPS
jgi:CPA2 family monovalent cation:H+ antiporter-2